MFGWTNTKRISASGEASRNATLLGMTSLVANNVYDADGNLLGTVEEIVIDTRSGCVRHVVLAMGGFLGVGRRRIAVPWSALTPDADYRRCVANKTQMQLTAVRVPDDDPWLQRNPPVRDTETYASRAPVLPESVAIRLET